MYDLVIIGAGPSGMYASYLASLHNLSSIILEASIDHGGQLKLFLDKPVYDLPGHLEINGKKLMSLIYKQLSSNKETKIYFDEKVKEINGSIDNFSVITSKSNYKTRSVIIASGGGIFKPTPIGLKNEKEFSNIVYSIRNAKNYLNKKIVILGGGDTAIDWAYYFNQRKADVTLIHRRDSFRGQEHLLDKLKKEIDIMTPYKIVELIGNDKVKKIIIMNIKTKVKEEITCDVLMVFYGQQKLIDIENLYKIKQDKMGYFVKSNMETTREGIFAIGNVANYKGKVRTMVTAFGESATAVGSVIEIVKPGKKMSYYVKKKEN